jgi:hypothetical protein
MSEQSGCYTCAEVLAKVLITGLSDLAGTHKTHGTSTLAHQLVAPSTLHQVSFASKTLSNHCHGQLQFAFQPFPFPTHILVIWMISFGFCRTLEMESEPRLIACGAG